MGAYHDNLMDFLSTHLIFFAFRPKLIAYYSDVGFTPLLRCLVWDGLNAKLWVTLFFIRMRYDGTDSARSAFLKQNPHMCTSAIFSIQNPRIGITLIHVSVAFDQLCVSL